MAKTIYMISYDLKIYTKPDIWDKEYKKYNENTGFFEELTSTPKDIVSNTLQITTEVAQLIMKNVIHSNYGKILKKDKMDWYLKFDDAIKKRPSLLENDNLLFNYLVLKSMLVGMEEDIAIAIYSTYLNSYIEKPNEIISYDTIIQKLDELIINKKFWIPDCDEELQEEGMFVDDVIRKRSTSSDYKFEQFEKRYLKICNEGYIKKIKEYNENEDNLYSKGISFEEQKDFLLRYYSKMTNILIDGLASYYDYFNGNFASKKALHDNMKRIMEYAMKFW